MSERRSQRKAADCRRASGLLADWWRARARNARAGRRYRFADGCRRGDLYAPDRGSLVGGPIAFDRCSDYLALCLPHRGDAVQRSVIRTRVGRRHGAGIPAVCGFNTSEDGLAHQFPHVRHAVRNRRRWRGKRGNTGENRQHESRRSERTHRWQT